MYPLLFLLFLIPFSLLFKSFFSKKPNLPPSPASLPFIGHLHLLSRLPHRSLQSLSLRYGRADSSHIMLLNLPSPTLVVSTAAAAELVLKTHDLAFASRPASLSKGITGRNVSLSEYGNYWRQSKKFTIVHLLSQKRVFSAPFQVVCAEELTSMMAHLSTNKGEVNLSDCFYAYANGVVSRAVAGKENNAEKFSPINSNKLVLEPPPSWPAVDG